MRRCPFFRCRQRSLTTKKGLSTSPFFVTHITQPSEFSGYAEGVGDASLFFCPAGEVEVGGPWVVFCHFGFPAEFKEAAGAFHGRGRGVEVSPAGSCVAVKFVGPADACVAGFFFVDFFCPSYAESGSVGVDGVEVVGVIFLAVMDDCAVASKAGVEEFAVVVEGGVFSGDDFAKACFSCDVGGVAVVGGVDAVDVSFEVTGESAGADHGFVVEAVVSVSAVEDAAAGVVLVALA